MDVSKTETTDLNGKTIVFLKSPKFTQSLVVYKKNDGFVLYGVRWEKQGPVPAELSGSYTRIPDAIKACEKFIEHSKKSRAKRTNDNTARREKQKSS